MERAAWALLLAALATARAALRAECARPPDLGHGFAEERAGWVEGDVLEVPVPARRGLRFPLRVEASTLSLVRGTTVSVWCRAEAGAPRAGARVRMHLALRAPRPCTTPGGFDETAWLAARGAALWGRVTGAAWEQTRAPPPSLAGYLEGLRRRWSARLAARVPGEAGEFLRGLLLGERGRVSPEAVDDLRRAGVLHLLALSGQHVVLVAALLAALARILGAAGAAEAAVATAGVWLYALLTGASPSVVRAATAATLTALARLLGRRGSDVETLVWSAALGACASPRLALDVGFQLSCLASGGLVAAGRAGRALGRRLRPPPNLLWATRAAAPAGMAVLGTSCAQAAVLPLLAAQFGAVSGVGLASNLAMVPACAALLSLGLPLLVVDSLVPTPGSLWRVLAALAAFLLQAGSAFAAWPLAWLPCILPPGLAVAAVAAAALAAAGALARTASERPPHPAAPLGRRPRRMWAPVAVWAGGTAWCSLVVFGFLPRREAPRAVVSYWLLDVGQGDAQVLEFHDGRVLVVDTGDAREGYDAGARVLAPFLRARGVRAVDLVVLTHEDQDHVGGWRGLARDVPVRQLAAGREALAVLGGRESWGPRPPRLRTAAAGDTLMAGPGYRVVALWPPPGETGLPTNARAVVLQVEAGGDRLFLTADTDSTAEAGWLGRARAPASLLKLGHHGARSSTGDRLLVALRPRRAVVSCGRGNRFGHPHPETLSRLRERGIPLWRTDRDGTARVDLGGRPPPARRRGRNGPSAGRSGKATARPRRGSAPANRGPRIYGRLRIPIWQMPP